jgi:opacity protein-like surface antigen
MAKTRAALFLVDILCAAASIAPLAATASPASAAAGDGAAAWKQVFETGQTIYYVSAADPPRAGEAAIETLLEFKVPQVVAGAQAWSMVSHMKLDCDGQRVMTTDNTFYALPMGAGAAVRTEAANDLWHEPEPGSLGELVWSVGCRKN